MNRKEIACVFYLLVQVVSANDAPSTSNEVNQTNRIAKKIIWKDIYPKAELCNLTETLFALEAENDATEWVSVDLQGMAKKGSREDMAPYPLLSIKDAVCRKETMKKLRKLYDNYFPEVNKPEVITEEERQEDWDFLNAVMETPVFQAAKEFLIAKKILNEENFNGTIYRIWFEQYPRAKNRLGSSGFEHVFLGELKRGVSGFHNWLYFGHQEKRETLNYLGYIRNKELGANKSLITHSFKWLNQLKPISSMFIGTSPEFEMSLFTVCWFVRPNTRCWFTLNGTEISAQTYVININNKTYIGSVYADSPPDKANESTKTKERLRNREESVLVRGVRAALDFMAPITPWF